MCDRLIFGQVSVQQGLIGKGTRYLLYAVWGRGWLCRGSFRPVFRVVSESFKVAS